MADTSKSKEARLAARMMKAPDGYTIKVGGSVLRKEGKMENGAPKWVKVPVAPSKQAVKKSIRPKARETIEDVKLELQSAEWNRVQKKQKTLLALNTRSQS